MKYKYNTLKKFNYSKSNLNVACWDVEKWWTILKRTSNNVTTSQCMVDDNIPLDENKYKEVLKIFGDFKKQYSKMQQQESLAKNFELYKEFWEDIKPDDIKNTKLDWEGLYNDYKARLEKAVSNQAELANMIVDIVYNQNKGTHYKFAWWVAEEGILTNLRKNRIEPLLIPIETGDLNDVEYLGRYYKLTEYVGVF